MTELMSLTDRGREVAELFLRKKQEFFAQFREEPTTCRFGSHVWAAARAWANENAMSWYPRQTFLDENDFMLSGVRCTESLSANCAANEFRFQQADRWLSCLYGPRAPSQEQEDQSRNVRGNLDLWDRIYGHNLESEPASIAPMVFDYANLEQRVLATPTPRRPDFSEYMNAFRAEVQANIDLAAGLHYEPRTRPQGDDNMNTRIHLKKRDGWTKSQPWSSENAAPRLYMPEESRTAIATEEGIAAGARWERTEYKLVKERETKDHVRNQVTKDYFYEEV